MSIGANYFIVLIFKSKTIKSEIKKKIVNESIKISDQSEIQQQRETVCGVNLRLREKTGLKVKVVCGLTSNRMPKNEMKKVFFNV